MTKGLEELEALKLTLLAEGYHQDVLQSCAIIEAELKELKEHEEILNDYGLTLANFREACLLLAQWKSAGLCWADYEKQKRALEIIKKKRVDINHLLKCQELDYYNSSFYNRERELTQGEYNLLKEVLS